MMSSKYLISWDSVIEDTFQSLCLVFYYCKWKLTRLQHTCCICIWRIWWRQLVPGFTKCWEEWKQRDSFSCSLIKVPPIHSLTRHTCPPDPRSHICHLGNFVKISLAKKCSWNLWICWHHHHDTLILQYIILVQIQCVQEREKQNGKKEPRCSPTAGHAWKRSIFCCSYFIAYPLTKVEMVMMLWRILRMPRMPRGLSNRLSRVYWMPLNSVH